MSVWLYRFRAYKNWLKKPMHIWVAVLVTVAVWAGTAIVIFLGASCEPPIRIAGLVFQLAGIGTVIKGIHDTRRLFGVERFFAPLRQLLQQRPPWVPRSVSLTGHAAGVGGLTAHAQVWTYAGPNDPLEKRIAALEKNLSDVNNRLSQLASDDNKRFYEITDLQNSENLKQNNRIDQIDSKLKAASTGGIYLSMTGVFWIALGIIMSTVPSEISALTSAMGLKCLKSSAVSGLTSPSLFVSGRFSIESLPPVSPSGWPSAWGETVGGLGGNMGFSAISKMAESLEFLPMRERGDSPMKGEGPQRLCFWDTKKPSGYRGVAGRCRKMAVFLHSQSLGRAPPP
jgi:hypothetical protein